MNAMSSTRKQPAKRASAANAKQARAQRAKAPLGRKKAPRSSPSTERTDTLASAKKARKKASTKKASTKQAPARQGRGKKVSTASSRTSAKKAAPARTASRATHGKVAGRPAPRHHAARSDYGAPIDAFFAKQPPELRKILELLRALVDEVVPDAESAIKWGMPVYSLRGSMMCALGAHKSHVNLVLAGSPAAFADPEKLLTGTGKTGRHLKLSAASQVPREAVRSWLRTAAAIARQR